LGGLCPVAAEIFFSYKTQGNLFVFDFFQLLSDDYGYLKPEYTPLIWIDSHPNKKANKTIAPIFAKFIVEIANK
jgi:hypothetical protein